jgi:hypothetical protein
LLAALGKSVGITTGQAEAERLDQPTHGMDQSRAGAPEGSARPNQEKISLLVAVAELYGRQDLPVHPGLAGQLAVEPQLDQTSIGGGVLCPGNHQFLPRILMNRLFGREDHPFDAHFSDFKLTPVLI